MQKPTIFVVDDDRNIIVSLGRMLGDVGQLRFATSGVDALRMLSKAVPDLILLDVEMPEMNGFELCSRLKTEPALSEVPVIFITSHGSEEQQVRGLSLGAVDFITKPLHAALARARVGLHLRLKELSDALRKAAITDALTGIANRRQFDAVLERDWSRALRARMPLALLLVDVDFFKAYNDRYGHLAGDVCLQQVAATLERAACRAGDLRARYGGEEFALLLPETDGPGAEVVARRLLRTMAELNLPHEGSGVAAYVTVSVGIAAYDPSCAECAQAFDAGSPPPPPQRLVAAADRALYMAKRDGRARSCRLPCDLGQSIHSATPAPSPIAASRDVDDPRA